MRGIIIDGVASAGKTSVLKLLQDRITKEKSNSTKFFLSEHYTQRMLEHYVDSNSLNGSIVSNHITQIIDNLGLYDNLLAHSKFSKSPKGAELFITIERFILTFLSTQPQIVKDYSIKKINHDFRKIHDMNIRQYIFILSPGVIKSNVSKTLEHRSKIWSDYVNSRGGLDKLCEYYVIWQNDILQFAKKFDKYIQTEVINMDKANYQEVSDYIYTVNYKPYE